MVSLSRWIVMGWFFSLTLSSYGSELCDGVVIRQEASPVAAPGERIDYRIWLYHSGDCQVGELEVSDYLPQGSQLILSNPEPHEFPDSHSEDSQPWPVNRLKWKDVVISSGQKWGVQLQVRLSEIRTGWIRNVVCISGESMIRRCSEVETLIRRD